MATVTKHKSRARYRILVEKKAWFLGRFLTSLLTDAALERLRTHITSSGKKGSKTRLRLSEQGLSFGHKIGGPLSDRIPNEFIPLIDVEALGPDDRYANLLLCVTRLVSTIHETDLEVSPANSCQFEILAFRLEGQSDCETFRIHFQGTSGGNGAERDYTKVVAGTAEGHTHREGSYVVHTLPPPSSAREKDYRELARQQKQRWASSHNDVSTRNAEFIEADITTHDGTAGTTATATTAAAYLPQFHDNPPEAAVQRYATTTPHVSRHYDNADDISPRGRSASNRGASTSIHVPGSGGGASTGHLASSGTTTYYLDSAEPHYHHHDVTDYSAPHTANGSIPVARSSHRDASREEELQRQVAQLTREVGTLRTELGGSRSTSQSRGLNNGTTHTHHVTSAQTRSAGKSSSQVARMTIPNGTSTEASAISLEPADRRPRYALIPSARSTPDHMVYPSPPSPALGSHDDRRQRVESKQSFRSEGYSSSPNQSWGAREHLNSPQSRSDQRSSSVTKSGYYRSGEQNGRSSRTEVKSGGARVRSRSSDLLGADDKVTYHHNPGWTTLNSPSNHTTTPRDKELLPPSGHRKWRPDFVVRSNSRKKQSH